MGRANRTLREDTKPKRWNSPIQWLAADALKAIAVAVDDPLGEILGAEMVGLVHDEVLLLVPEEHAGRATEWLTEIMEGVGDAVVNGRGARARREVALRTSR